MNDQSTGATKRIRPLDEIAGGLGIDFKSDLKPNHIAEPTVIVTEQMCNALHRRFVATADNCAKQAAYFEGIAAELRGKEKQMREFGENLVTELREWLDLQDQYEQRAATLARATEFV